MKSIFSFLLVALLSIVSLPVNAAVADAILVWDKDTTLCATSAFDTILAANDSSLICASRQFDPNWEYYLSLSRLTGTSKDTSNLCIAVDAYTFNDSLIGRARSDTSADRSEAYLFTLPIGKSDATTGNFFVGDKYRLKVMNVSTGTTTAETILNVMEIRKARPIQLHRMIGR